MDKPKVLNFNEITEVINKLQFTEKSEKQDMIKLVNSFCSVQNNKEITDEEIKQLFKTSCDKVNDKLLINFIVEVLPRFYYKDNYKYSLLILGLIKTVAQNYFNDVLDINIINELISKILEVDGIERLKNYLKSVLKSNDKDFQDKVILLFILFIIRTKEIQKYRFKDFVIGIERAFVETYAIQDKNDIFDLRGIFKSFGERKFEKKFSQMSFIYNDVVVSYNDTLSKNIEFQNIIFNRNDKIEELSISLNNAEKKINLLTQELESEKKINEKTRIDLQGAYNKNEFNENMYEQQYRTLKKSLIEKLKKDLGLEIQGIDDIAENLTEAQRLKIQRRIDNIYKILQKIGE